MAARSNDCLAMADHLVKLFNNGFILCGWDFGGEEKKYGWLVGYPVLLCFGNGNIE
ncbi:hypothetical protein HanXRQr2_Chr12g0545951 [Helianthus annuus]|uniref:Uncharacterized protein n=1 Tax=Helianthus annuus TaxID=4232 RepID=A0A9K3HH76_HELAN|nr:hypothetical protein HanXRQr2_Chr12g0545951 [Helianthus annuus]KAJ0863060.1 hypothetical protein HanPSC8_Chr12g0525561 [Helianthus annuus]